MDHGLVRNIFGHSDPLRILFANITGPLPVACLALLSAALLSMRLLSPSATNASAAWAVSSSRTDGTQRFVPTMGLATTACKASAFSGDALIPPAFPNSRVESTFCSSSCRCPSACWTKDKLLVCSAMSQAIFATLAASLSATYHDPS